MTQFLLQFTISLALSNYVFAKDKDAKMNNVWFSHSICSNLEIQKTIAGEKKPSLKIQISDSDAIAGLIKRIQQISPNGEKMKSFIAAEILTLNFKCGSETTVIKIYDGSFQTPTTGFNSDPENLKIEKPIYADLNALFNPALNHKILKIKDLELKFPEFTIKYLGFEKFDHAPATISGVNYDFLVKDKSGNEQKIQVTSGQLPPQPEIFAVDKKNFILNTFKSKNSENLYPFYIELVVGDSKVRPTIKPLQIKKVK